MAIHCCVYDLINSEHILLSVEVAFSDLYALLEEDCIHCKRKGTEYSVYKAFLFIPIQRFHLSGYYGFSTFISLSLNKLLPWFPARMVSLILSVHEIRVVVKFYLWLDTRRMNSPNLVCTHMPSCHFPEAHFIVRYCHYHAWQGALNMLVN